MHKGCTLFPLIKNLSILETSFQHSIIYTPFYIVLLNVLFILMLNQSRDLTFHCALSCLVMRHCPLTPQISLSLKSSEIT